MDCNVLSAAREAGHDLVSMCDWRDSCKCLAWKGAIPAGMLTLFHGHIGETRGLVRLLCVVRDGGARRRD